MTRFRAGLVAIGVLVLLGCGPQHEQALDDGAGAVLTRAADALRDARNVTHAFTFGGPDDPSGWATGETAMVQVTDVSDSWIRVEGTLHAQPAFGTEQVDFVYTFDGERAWSRNGGPDAPWQQALADAGANGLASNAVYGFLPEFVEETPLWKERAANASARLVGTEVVDGELCDRVEVVVRPAQGDPSISIWSFARSDHLPRRGEWPGTPGTPSMVFTIERLDARATLQRDAFQVDAETDASPTRVVAIGEPLRPFGLTAADGATVTQADFASQVVVLEFWNTWCYLCRTLAPETHALARELAGQPVRFYGVNIFETGDPIAYWREAGEPYALLLEGDTLATQLDLPWQPGVAVIGHDGTLRWKQLGASPDRTAKIRRAVADALARM